MTITITKLYDLLAAKLGKGTAENLDTFIENKINQGLENKTNVFATKDDLAKVVGETKAELLKWMFIFWVSQMVGTFGFLLLFIKK